MQDIYNNIKGLTINSFEGTTIIDPAVDLGDKIIVDGKTIVFQGEMRLQRRFIADIKSTISIKNKEETTVRKISQKTINRKIQSRINEEEARIILLAQETSKSQEKISQLEVNLDGIKAEVSKTKEEMNEALETTKEELKTEIQVSVDGIESNVSKKLESYSTTNEMNSAITQKANEITTNVGKTYSTKNETTEQIKEVKTEIKQTTDAINLKVEAKLDEKEFTGGNIMLAINNDSSEAQINADKISLSGKEINLTGDNTTIKSTNFSVDKNGNVTAKSGNIGGFKMNATQFTSDLTMDTIYTEDDSERIRQIILGNIIPTNEDLEKYDLTRDGVFDSLDLLLVRKLINGDTTPNAKFYLNTNDSKDALEIVAEDDSKKVVSLGRFGGYIQRLGSQEVTVSNSINVSNAIIINNEETSSSGYFGVSTFNDVRGVSLNLDNIFLIGKTGEIRCNSLYLNNEELFCKTIWTGEKVISTTNGSNRTLSNMPDLTEYVGKTVNFYIKYGGDQIQKFSFIVGNTGVYWIEYVRDYNGNDIWHTLFAIEDTDSKSWKISTKNSYVIADANISKVNITNNNYIFYLEKVTITNN